MTDDIAIRTELVQALRSMNALGINSGTSGNVSVRSGDGMLISPTGIPYDQLQPEQIVRMDLDGGYAGELLPSSEWRFHSEILKSRDDINAVVHTHSTCATAISILQKPIPAVHYVIAAAGGTDIRCAPYHLFGTQDLADAVLEAMAGRRACLMAHHGVIAGEATLARALALAVTVEEIATLYLRTLPMGDPPILSDAEMALVLEKFKTYGQQGAENSLGVHRLD